MTTPLRTTTSKAGQSLDKRLAAYLTAAGAVGTVLASDAEAIIVFNQTPQPIGINGAVPIDFNGDGQIDYEIDHDRVDLGGGLGIVDYLQIDKNDINGAPPLENPLPIDIFDTFDLNGTMANDTFNAKYVTNTNQAGSYPAALEQNALIGPGSNLDWQEADNFQGAGTTIRANRLIDEDAGQVDQALGGLSSGQVQVPFDGPNFVGLAGEVRYLGVQMDFENTNFDHYGWIGIRVDNEADATATVVGWAYNDTPFASIRAGQIPEPSSIVMTALGSAALLGTAFMRWLRGR